MCSLDDSLNEDFENILDCANEPENDNQQTQGNNETPSKSRSKSSGIYSQFLLCEEHEHQKNNWSITVNGNCDKCINFTKSDSLPNGRLPTKQEVLCHILTQNQEHQQKGQR